MDICQFRLEALDVLPPGSLFRFEGNWAFRVELPLSIEPSAEVEQGFIWLEGSEAGKWRPAWQELVLTPLRDVQWRVDVTDFGASAGTAFPGSLGLAVCSAGAVLRGEGPDGVDVDRRVRNRSVHYGVRDGKIRRTLQGAIHFARWAVVIGSQEDEFVAVEVGASHI
ncbi:hypothetical protein BV378_14320 [Nostoc sp. RF31YmG]|nr:hypothetical protein BV378_14320 [Nostoc sp. RF31YmG]